jgi:hypothetical protein
VTETISLLTIFVLLNFTERFFRMLHENDIKEELSRIYLHAIATQLGYSVERPTNDRDSIDAKICARGKLVSESIFHSPSLEVQLKATSQEYKGDEIAFQLPIKNYDDLRAPTMNPRFLMLLLLPRDLSECIAWSPNELLIRGEAYWSSLQGRELCENAYNKTIIINKANRFNAESLKRLMIQASIDKRVPNEL